jgi:hypothetical protein
MIALPAHLTPVAMAAESGCSRCARRILLLEKAFLDENYAAVCVHCAGACYSLALTALRLKSPNTNPLRGPEADGA